MKSIEKLFAKHIAQQAPMFNFNTDLVPLPQKTTPSIVNSDVFVGIEIEVEHAQPFNDAYGIWMGRSDGSLRNGGLEWVSYPIRGWRIVSALYEFYRCLNEVTRGSYHFSPRTSIHIHMDVRKLLMSDVVKILMVYLAVEPLLYKFVGSDRGKGVFCVPLHETYLVNDLATWMEKYFPGTPMEHSRYAGLNLAALQKFGTLEFRHLGGTDDVEHIVTWINLLLSIYTYSISQDIGDLVHQISELNTNSYYIDFIRRIFGKYTTHLDLSNVKSDLEKGVKAVKQSTVNNKMYAHLRDNVSPKSPAMKWYAKHGARRTMKINPYLPIEPNVGGGGGMTTTTITMSGEAPPFPTSVYFPDDFLGD